MSAGFPTRQSGARSAPYENQSSTDKVWVISSASLICCFVISSAARNLSYDPVTFPNVAKEEGIPRWWK